MKKSINLIVGVIIFQFIIFLIFRNNIYIEIHDNLDAPIVWLKNMRDYNVFFKSGTIPMLDSLNRDYLPSEFQLYNIFYYFFPTLLAYLLTYFIKIILGTYSFYICMKEIFKDKVKEKKEFFLMMGFIYSLLPGYPNLYFAQVTIPLILYLFIKLNREEKKLKYYILIFLYPILSEFTRYGMFILGYLGVYIIYDSIKSKRIKKENIIAGILLSLGYIITEYRLFYVIFLSGQESIRKQFELGVLTNLGVIRGIKESIIVFLKGQYHAQSQHFYLILPVFLLYFIYELKNKNFSFLNIIKENKKLLLIIIFITINTIIYGIYYIESITELVAKILPPLKGWNFGRTVWFNPFLWYLLLLSILIKLKNKAVVQGIIILQLMIVLVYPGYANDFIRTLFFNTIKSTKKLSYQEFFSEELFEQIKKEINYKNEKSVAFGFHPSVLNYNKINTLDGYHNAYSLEYKKKFRKIISPELELDEKNRNYFDGWGGRAYIFSKTISYHPLKFSKKEEADIIIDIDEFKKLDGKYIFSRVLLKNVEKENLKLVNIYENKVYKIYLYTVN